MLFLSRKIVLLSFMYLSILIPNNYAMDGQEEHDRAQKRREQPVYEIYECSRMINVDIDSNSIGIDKTPRIPNNPIFPRHCYLQLRENGRAVDSRGFYGDAGSIMEPDNGQTITTQCRRVTSSNNLEAWQKALGIFDQHTLADYHNYQRNCCTAAEEAVRAFGGRPLMTMSQNFGIGTAFSKTDLPKEEKDFQKSDSK